MATIPKVNYVGKGLRQPGRGSLGINLDPSAFGANSAKSSLELANAILKLSQTSINFGLQNTQEGVIGVWSGRG